MEQNKRTPSPELVEQYRRQMLALYGQQPSAPVAEENWLDSRFPEPVPERDREAVALPEPPATPEPPAPEPPPIAETPFVGYLRVFVFTGAKAEPLAETRVTVTRGDTVFANTVTDRDGYTQVIPLPSVNPELTLTPGNTTPYVTYDILVNADGFRPVRHENVPVYGNTYVTQPVSLLPVVPGENPEEMQDFVSGGPTNL
ncbi:MAG: carboxypeptidase regulatory-like domain-containing protein [Ruminococcaceae bacterium]|nr:carboxypeptidase regulatory-like domain-containing protein [Oscillospiraceae bacterium]